MKLKKQNKEKNKDKKTKKEKYKEISSGGVVFYINSDQKVKFLLLKHKGKKKHWDVPKGHFKKKETREECAIREVLEETGMPKSDLKLIQELDHKNIYTKRNSLRKKYKKIVHLFLFQAFTKEVQLSKEHSDSKWVKFEKLEEKLTYPDTTLLAFVEANDIIKKLYFNGHSNNND